jgi:hypothetical protein
MFKTLSVNAQNRFDNLPDPFAYTRRAGRAGRAGSSSLRGQHVLPSKTLGDGVCCVLCVGCCVCYVSCVGCCVVKLDEGSESTCTLKNVIETQKSVNTHGCASWGGRAAGGGEGGQGRAGAGGGSAPSKSWNKQTHI